MEHLGYLPKVMKLARSIQKSVIIVKEGREAWREGKWEGP